MKEELEKTLVAKYPKILADYRGNPMETCMAWGIECDDGWYNLLDKCLEKIQHLCDLVSSKGEVYQIVASQIKEKYGTLRFYYGGTGGDRIADDIIDDIIAEAERQSTRICENTGADGAVCHRGSWYRTLSYEEARKNNYVACDKHTEEYWKSLDEKKQKTQ
jgi:hypothetical protein